MQEQGQFLESGTNSADVIMIINFTLISNFPRPQSDALRCPVELLQKITFHAALTIRNSVDVDSSGSYIGAYQEPDFFSLGVETSSDTDRQTPEGFIPFLERYLETLQVVLPLVGLTVAVETDAGELVASAVWT